MKRFQEFLEDTNSKLFLKYDGEREKKVYTIKVFNKGKFHNSLGSDTDNPEEMFNSILNELNCQNPEEFYIVYDAFKKIVYNIKLRFGNESIVSFIVDCENNKLIFMFFVEQAGRFVNYSEDCIQNIISRSTKIILK